MKLEPDVRACRTSYFDRLRLYREPSEHPFADVHGEQEAEMMEELKMLHDRYYGYLCWLASGNGRVNQCASALQRSGTPLDGQIGRAQIRRKNGGTGCCLHRRSPVESLGPRNGRSTEWRAARKGWSTAEPVSQADEVSLKPTVAQGGRRIRPQTPR